MAVICIHRRSQVVRAASEGLRHGLVDGFHAVSHRELVDDLLRRLLEVHLPSIVALGIWDPHHTVVLDVGHVVEQVLPEQATVITDWPANRASECESQVVREHRPLPLASVRADCLSLITSFSSWSYESRMEV